MTLVDRVRPLLRSAVAEYSGTRQGDALAAAAEALDGPLRVAIVGMTNAGKSTLLNALIGERLAATDAAECTRVVTRYADGVSAQAWAHPHVGEPEQLSFTRDDGATRLELGHFRPEDLRDIAVETPNPHLRELTYVDTPGTASLTVENSARTVELMTTTSQPDSADAVVYLLRHLHTADVNFLEAFRGEGAPEVRPISSVAVLSRADEIGAGRFDALDIARQVAARYRHDRRIRGLVQTVVPIAGLIAETAATLREHEFQAVGQLAARSVAETHEDLLSPSRFLDGPIEGLSRERRQALLVRLGVFGIRLSVALIRHDVVVDATGLASRLLDVSGVPDLRELLRSRFGQRRDVLKVQHALQRLEVALAERPVPAARALQAQLEETLATLPDIVELRLLNDLATRDIAVDDQYRSRLELLLGADGTAAPVRLGLADERGVPDAAVAELHYWKAVMSGPLATPAERRASRVAARACERIIASSPTPHRSAAGDADPAPGSTP